MLNQFQNIHTFTYQKTLLHTFFCLFLKSSKAFECIFNPNLNRSIFELRNMLKVSLVVCTVNIFYPVPDYYSKESKLPLELKEYYVLKIWNYLSCKTKTTENLRGFKGIIKNGTWNSLLFGFD